MIAQFHCFEGGGEFFFDLLEIFDCDSLQGQCFLMVFACDCSDADSFGSFVFV